jgi:hypothetical protein
LLVAKANPEVDRKAKHNKNAMNGTITK